MTFIYSFSNSSQITRVLFAMILIVVVTFIGVDGVRQNQMRFGVIFAKIIWKIVIFFRFAFVCLANVLSPYVCSLKVVFNIVISYYYLHKATSYDTWIFTLSIGYFTLPCSLLASDVNVCGTRPSQNGVWPWILDKGILLLAWNLWFLWKYLDMKLLFTNKRISRESYWNRNHRASCLSCKLSFIIYHLHSRGRVIFLCFIKWTFPPFPERKEGGVLQLV